MVELVPSVLEHSLEEAQVLFRQLAGVARRIQVDFADNQFVANKTFMPKDLPLDLPFEVEAHLMVNEPTKYFTDLAERDIERVIVHLESHESVDDILIAAADHNLTIGLAINPLTSIDRLLPYSQRVGFIQLMDIEPGFGGQPMAANALERLQRARELMPEKIIAVDGAVRLTNASQLINAGANILVVGKGGLSEGDSLVQGIHSWQRLLGIRV